MECALPRQLLTRPGTLSDDVDTSPMGRSREGADVERDAAENSRRPLRLALALALVALLASLVGAVGPAEHVRAVYSWPPPTLPASDPPEVWYTPLLLARGQPDVLTARIPCAPAQPLPEAARPATVIATARSPMAQRGLAVMQGDDGIEIWVGDRMLDRLDVPAKPTTDCAYRLVLDGDSWSISGGGAPLERTGELATMPTVYGLFSALDLRSGAGPSIEITTAVHDTRSTTRQDVARSVALFGVLAALLLGVGLGRGLRPLGTAVLGVLRRVASNARPADGVVAGLLATWWIIEPAMTDDGWVAARIGNYAESGGYSMYYAVSGANMPLGYWHEWLLRLVAEVSTALVVLRLPLLLCLAVAWLLCRWTLIHTLGPAGSRGLALWTLAATFTVGAVAWTMTLRPEVFVAVLTTGVLACMARFLTRPTPAPVAGAAILVPLAIVAHPAGLVSLGPVLAAFPSLVRWARRRVLVAMTLLTAGVGLLITLTFIGSDVVTWMTDVRLQRTEGGGEASPWDELDRYTGTLFGASTPTRHVSLTLVLLALVSLVLSRAHRGDPRTRLPGLALAAGLVLLLATPSKWTGHIGGLIGIAAVAVSVETIRFRRSARRADLWFLPFLVIAMTVVLGVWAMSRRGRWNVLDLQTLEWTLGFESVVTLADAAALVPLLALAALLGVRLLRPGRDRLRDVPWRVAAAAALLLVTPAVVFTFAVLVADFARTPLWTPARQNLGALIGQDGCGVADAAVTPRLSSLTPVAPGSNAQRLPASLPPPPVPGLATFVLGASGRASTPWFDVSTQRDFGFFVADTQDLGPRAYRVLVEWGRRVGSHIDPARSVELRTSEPRADVLDWRFWTRSETTGDADGADVMRVILRGAPPSGSIVAATAPATFSAQTLTERLDSDPVPTLVMPFVFMYVPCATLPRLAEGVVQVPGSVLAWDNAWPIGLRTSAFTGLVDLHSIVRLPVIDASGKPRGAALYEIDQHIPGAHELAPVSREITS